MSEGQATSRGEQRAGGPDRERRECFQHHPLSSVLPQPEPRSPQPSDPPGSGSPLFPSAFASLNSEPSGGSVEPSPNSKRQPLALGRGTSPPKACRIPRQPRPFPPFPDCSRPVSPTGLTEATREWSGLQPRGSGHPRRSTRDPSPKHTWEHPASLQLLRPRWARGPSRHTDTSQAYPCWRRSRQGVAV